MKAPAPPRLAKPLSFRRGMRQLAAAMNDPTIISNLSKPAAAPANSGGSGNTRAKWLLLPVALIAVAASVGYWYATRDHATTDDAYTDGRAVMIAPRVAGLTVALAVTDNQRIRAGEVLPRREISARAV